MIWFNFFSLGEKVVQQNLWRGTSEYWDQWFVTTCTGKVKQTQKWYPAIFWGLPQNVWNSWSMSEGQTFLLMKNCWMDPWGKWKKVSYLYAVTCIPALWSVLKYRKQEIYQTKPDSRAVLSDFVFCLKKKYTIVEIIFCVAECWFPFVIYFQ